MNILAETLLVEEKIKRILLIEHFRNMWVVCCNGACGGARSEDDVDAFLGEVRWEERAPDACTPVSDA
jgi:hypothetical protein